MKQETNQNTAKATTIARLLRRLGVTTVAACAMIVIGCNKDKADGTSPSGGALASNKIIPLPDIYQNFENAMEKQNILEGEFGNQSKYYKKRVKTSGTLINVSTYTAQELIDGRMKRVQYPHAQLHVQLPNKRYTTAEVRFTDPGVMEQLKSKKNTEIQIAGTVRFVMQTASGPNIASGCLLFEDATLL
jgi:hypothetical protein